MSGAFFDNVRRNSPYTFENLGEKVFKNLSEAIRVYRVRAEIGPQRLLPSTPMRTKAAREKRPSSIAIMPFRVMGGDDEQRFLAEGLTDELIVEMARFKRVFVASRSATFALAEAQPDPNKIGDALSVMHVLEGQVRKIGDQLRIGLTLSRTDGGAVLWSDKIVQPFSELLNLLDQTAAKIAATVCGRLEDAGMDAARRKPPENMTAFEYLLRGLDHHRLGGVLEENSREAIKWFTKAIEADPNYAAAYAWRVCAAADLPDFDFSRSEPDIQRALELDPCDPEANRIAAVFELLKNNFDQAATLSRRAMELNPCDAYIKARSAWIMILVGEPGSALKLLDAAEALDPLLPVWCVEERGVALYALERYEEALEELGKLVFQTYRSRLYRAAAFVALDRPEPAKTLVKEALTGRPNLTAASFFFKERYRHVRPRKDCAVVWKLLDCHHSTCSFKAEGVGSRGSGIAAASFSAILIRRAAWASSITPPSDDRRTPSNPAVSFLPRTAGNQNGRVVTASASSIATTTTSSGARRDPVIWNRRSRRGALKRVQQ